MASKTRPLIQLARLTRTTSVEFQLGKMALVKEGDQDFATKRFPKATAQESLSEVNQTLQIRT